MNDLCEICKTYYAYCGCSSCSIDMCGRCYLKHRTERHPQTVVRKGDKTPVSCDLKYTNGRE